MAGNREPIDVTRLWEAEIDPQPSMFNENRRLNRSSSESEIDQRTSMLDANRGYEIRSREAEVYRRPSRYGDDIRSTYMKLQDIHRRYQRSREAEIYEKLSMFNENRRLGRSSSESEIDQRASMLDENRSFNISLRVAEVDRRPFIDGDDVNRGYAKWPTTDAEIIRQLLLCNTSSRGTDKKPSPRDDSPKTQQQQRIRQKEIDKMPPTRDDSLKTLQQQMIIQKVPADAGQPNGKQLLVNDHNKYKSMLIRAYSSIWMIGGFIFVVYMGHLYIWAMVVIIQIFMAKKLFGLLRKVNEDKQLPGFRHLNWHFFFTAMLFVYGRILSQRLVNTVTTDKVLYKVVGNLIKYHMVTCYFLYIAGFVWFILSLKKKMYKYQFGQYAWTHMILIVVFTESFIVATIFEGIFWFLLPASLVVINDIAAYIFGCFFGKTPLIKLSPKKTWEGFIGASVTTIISAFVLANFMGRFHWLTCPRKDLSTGWLQCNPGPLFTPENFTLPGWLPEWFPWKEMEIMPVQWHALGLGLFASIIVPFRGFFASGFKRAFKIKDFGDSIPGHGGMTDRMDCQEGKRMEEQIAKEVKLEFLIHVLKEIPEIRLQKKENLEVRLQKKLAIRRLRKLKRELAKVWNELRILRQEDNRWSIQEEVANLFDVSLKLSYPEFKDVKSTIFSCIEKFGDYQCENVLSIWPKLRKDGHLGPRRVGWKIKRNLELLRSEMIVREPWVLDIGFVSIKLSGKWMAEGIHKMLRDGIDTWAPKLLMKSVLVNFPSCNPAYLTQMDLLRRELIKTTLMRMLQYCKIRVEFSMPCETALPQEQLDMFRIEKRVDGDVLIFRSAEGEREPLIHAKRDEWSGDPENDLADLWYGLKKKNANWIVCLTPVQQQEYIKMCIKAAQHAEWLPPNWRDSPRASYTGYQTYNTKLKHEDLDSFLDAAKSNCEAVGKELGYTHEEVVNCALKYTILKNDRLADYAFNSQEMQLNGNTFVYLLITQARIRSFTKESRKYINDFASQIELTLGKGEIWQDGKERVLVQHLLAFTQVVEESCLPVLLHILCEYLYDLSKNFNSLYEAGFVAETTNLLLYEATRVVMDKCFQLLGITPESSSLGVDCQLPSSELTKSLLQVESLNRKDPPKITTRFELFSIYPHITRDPEFKEGNLFGQIAISDTYSLLSDGWGLTSVPDHGYVALFDCDWPSSIDITNHRAVYFGNPSSRNLVPFSSFMEVRVELYASTEGNDAVFELCNCYIDAEFEDFLRGDGDTRRSMWISEGKDGHIRMYYILLKDAKDSTIKVTYHPQRDKEDYGGEVFAEIFAYYGSDFFDKKVDPFEKNYYTARLFRNSFDPNMPEIPLQKSMLAVPANGSIEIVACLWDVDSGDMILNDRWTFRAGVVDEQKKDGSCGSLHVSVKWN